ncbi:hypothetical protein GGE45_002596 [Rhizobium aethiopicum]|uniref:Uncharacterized protein n=1 Tax=Rhizobium aethiopicum TaxID=1138170 RepID=A0A7W6Q7X3_9HYPH|nr:hypothetical protein [Rhizobium aethiopicum]MBB4580266.1 hypothetical protein [Rhizobium aethiopicum]
MLFGTGRCVTFALKCLLIHSVALPSEPILFLRPTALPIVNDARY